MRAAARGHLDVRGPGWRAVELCGFRHELIGRRGGEGGGRGGERGALHDPIVLKIVVRGVIREAGVATR